MTRPLHAITLHPEWSWAIAYIPEPLAKRCENRTWTPSPRQLQPGDWLAIHAGALSCSRERAREDGLCSLRHLDPLPPRQGL